MSLLVESNHSDYVHIIEHDNYWVGQMKSDNWLERHNEDCDAILDCDMDWGK